MHFPGLVKLMILGEMAKIKEKLWNFVFWTKYFMLFEHAPLDKAKLCPKKAGFSAFLCNRKFEMGVESC